MDLTGDERFAMQMKLNKIIESKKDEYAAKQPRS
jgi:hypothetical protein